MACIPIAAAAWPLAGILCVAALPAEAHMQPATHCKMAQLLVKGLQFSGAHIVALHSPRTEIVCPIDRFADISPSGFFQTNVYGRAPGGYVTCGLESYDMNGQFLGNDVLGNGGTINWDLVLGGTQVPPQSSQVLHCTMTPGAILFGYESFEHP